MTKTAGDPAEHHDVTVSRWPFGYQIKQLYHSVLLAHLFCEVTVALTFDIWPTKPNQFQFILESEWMFEPNLKTFSQCSREIITGWVGNEQIRASEGAKKGWGAAPLGILVSYAAVLMYCVCCQVLVCSSFVCSCQGKARVVGILLQE